MEERQGFDQWGIVEVMGRRRYAGHITEQEIAGASFVRVDVPEVTTRANFAETVIPAYTKYVGTGSVYMITPTTEDVARKSAVQIAQWDGDPLPVSLPTERQIPATVGASTDDDGDDFDDSDDDFGDNEVR